MGNHSAAVLSICAWLWLGLALCLSVQAATGQPVTTRRRARVRRDRRSDSEQTSPTGQDLNVTSSSDMPLTSPAPVPPPEPVATPPLPQSAGPDPEEGDLRLVARRELNGFVVGALQVFTDGAFGTICGAGFEEVDAQVACRQLGFIGGSIVPRAFSALTEAELSEAVAPVVLANPDCTGSEDRLVDCPITEYDSRTFFGDEYTPALSSCEGPQLNTFIACGTTDGPGEGALRLTGGSLSQDGLAQYGRLETFSAGGWGLACSPFFRSTFAFTPEDAVVACRSLGFSEGIAIRPLNVENDDQFLLPFLQSGPRCVGNESSLLDCPLAEAGATEARACFPGDYIELSCSSGQNPELEGRLRLRDGGSGPGYEYGRLEIFLRGFWSAVCDKAGFTPDSALVACRALGFEGGAAIRFTVPFQPRLDNEVLAADIPPGISAVDCNGTETSLLECISSKGLVLGRECSAQSSSASDATVLACASASTDCDRHLAAEQGAVRLRGGFGTPCDPVHSGFVEVFNDGEWGAICDSDNDFRNRDTLVADVVCRQLGFPHGTAVDSLTTAPGLRFDYYSRYYFLAEEAEEPQERFWLNSVQCRGPEQRLVDCDLGEGFQLELVYGLGTCDSDFSTPPRLHVACRQFAVPEAFEEVAPPSTGQIQRTQG